MTKPQERELEKRAENIIYCELRNAVDRDPECSFAMKAMLREWLERKQRGKGRPNRKLERAMIRDVFLGEVAAHPDRKVAAIRKELREQFGFKDRRQFGKITKLPT